MHEHGLSPRARQDGLLEETVGEELLLYDRDSHVAHCLSPVAASVWRNCDGEHSTTELAEIAGASESLVADALLELRAKNLLAAEPELIQSATHGISRREAIVRASRYGAAAAAGSLIVSASAATPAMASSGEEEKCCQCYTGVGIKCFCQVMGGTSCTDSWCRSQPGCGTGATAKIEGTQCVNNKCA